MRRFEITDAKTGVVQRLDHVEAHEQWGRVLFNNMLTGLIPEFTVRDISHERIET